MRRAFMAGGLSASALVIAAGLAVPAIAGSGSAGTGIGVRVGTISDVSGRCKGQNAEVEQATWHRYVYEEWMGCNNSIGFARSADGGRTWSAPVTMPRSSGAWDPAVTTAPDGTLYVAFMESNSAGYTYPVVDTSFDHGRTFPCQAALIPRVRKNWGDRDFVLAGPHGVVYLTWDYGPSAAEVKTVCSPGGSCGYSNGDLNAVVQKSTDYGRSWGPIVHVSPGFPASGGDSAPLVPERGGRIGVAYQGYDVYNKKTYALRPGYEYFTSSASGGRTWSAPVRVGGSAGTMSLAEWWIDGAIGIDDAGNMYITWDTQGKTRDIGWLSYSRNGGRTWSAPVRVTPDTDNATHIVQVVGVRPGIAAVAWLADNSPHGYALYLRLYSLARHGWLTGAVRVSRRFGSKPVWPGDTIGISALSPRTVMLSWGSAVTKGISQIYAAPVTLAPLCPA